mgnify:FL=1
MTVQERYEAARKMYADVGVDTDAAIAKLKEIPVSLHCWQGDDVTGFDHDGPLTGGIQTTGNYPGKAKTPEQLMQDMEEAMSLMPGKKKLNLHASYAIFEKGEFADRDKLEPKHFRKWVDFAKKHHVGIDFNPTFFSHDKVKDGLTLPELIEQENVEMPEYVTVSINEEFIATEEKESTVLKEGDNVEFLYFMGGGC